MIPKVSLTSSVQMPLIGLGTSSSPRPDPNTVQAAVVEAIKAGYRHFDTAFVYQSEQPLGEAIAEALDTGLIKSRQELFITSKLSPTFAEPQLVVEAIKTSLRYKLLSS